MTKTEKKSFHQSLAEWKLFIYNPTSGEFLGRTAKSWGERAAGRAAQRTAPFIARGLGAPAPWLGGRCPGPSGAHVLPVPAASGAGNGTRRPGQASFVGSAPWRPGPRRLGKPDLPLACLGRGNFHCPLSCDSATLPPGHPGECGRAPGVCVCAWVGGWLAGTRDGDLITEAHCPRTCTGIPTEKGRLGEGFFVLGGHSTFLPCGFCFEERQSCLNTPHPHPARARPSPSKHLVMVEC